MRADNPFLSLPFKSAFEQHHKSNIKHLFYVADDKYNKAIGYAQEFNIRSNRIRDYQKKNKVKGNLINLVLNLLNLKVIALGNGLLTNISNFSAVKLSNNIDFFNSLLVRIKDIQQLKKTLLRYKEDIQLRENHSKNSLIWAAQFDRNKIAKEWLFFYNKL